MTTRDAIAEVIEDALFLDPNCFDQAVLGIAEGAGISSVVAYDMDKVIDILMQQGMDRDEAEEFFRFNTLGAYMGERTPIFIDTRYAK